MLEQVQEIQTIVLLIGLVLLFGLESLKPFYTFFSGDLKKRGKHALRNLIIGGINSLMIILIFVGLWFIVASWADQQRFGVLHWLQDSFSLPLWAHAIGAMLLLDFWMYVWHRMNHEIPFFWRFHRVHHSDPNMDVTTASRFHVGEIFLSSVLRLAIIPLFGIYLWELLLYETIMFAVVQFHHANISIPKLADKVLRTVIVTPAMHRVHHSNWQPETDSNYSSLFSFWDRLARTFRLNPKPEEIKLGLKEFEDEDDQTVSGMMKTPLAKTDEK